MNKEAKGSSSFPYKTLIWALVAVISLFLFKDELKELLNRSEELSLFGINVKTSEGEIAKLADSIQIHQARIDTLIAEVQLQEHEIARLEHLKNQLARDASNCPDLQENTRKLDAEYIKIFKNNSSIRERADQLKSVQMMTDLKPETARSSSNQ